MKTNNNNITKSGFTVPEQYFEKFEKTLDQILHKPHDHGFHLSNIDSPGFSVPENYFENFEKNLSTQLEEIAIDRKLFSVNMVKKLVYVSGIAAMIAIAIIYYPRTTMGSLNFDSVAITDIQEYMENGNLEISDEQLVLLLDNENELESLFSNMELNQDVLEAYLLKQDLENELFIE